MLTDRFDLTVSTSSDAARDAYAHGYDLMLGGNAGAGAAFDRAIAADAGFALAHVARARVLQMQSDMVGARDAMAAATGLAGGLAAREASHVAIFQKMFAGHADDALAALRTHLQTWPRDAMVLNACATPGGLIGMSGQVGREAEQVALMDTLAPHYGDDWWFGAHYGHALVENGQRDAARPVIDRSLAQNPRNPWAAHAKAHLCYEDGDRESARSFMAGFLPGYARDGQLYGHLSWHLALCELEAGNDAEAFRLYNQSFAPDVYQGGAMIVLADVTSFLWRTELAGHHHDPARWQAMRDFANRMFPRAGMAFADWHIALADAATGDAAGLEARVQRMEELAGAGRYPSGPVIPALARAFAAFQRQDFHTAIDALAPLMTQRERMGGSRAQTDLVEFTLLQAYLKAGRPEAARTLLDMRRPGPGGVPVAGLAAVH